MVRHYVNFNNHDFYRYSDTADGTENSLGNLVGGRCGDGKMKMKIYVCNGTNDPRCKKGNNGKLNIAPC